MGMLGGTPCGNALSNPHYEWLEESLAGILGGILDGISWRNPRSGLLEESPWDSMEESLVEMPAEIPNGNRSDIR